MTMAAAAAPYVTWLSAASAQAEQVANQARASAGAYELAFCATVPPPMIAANRTQLMTLIATNVLGQNCAAIAATEAEYCEMWAQDVTAMTCYDTSTAAVEAQATPFAQPPAGLPGSAIPAQSALIDLQLVSSTTRSPLFSQLSSMASRLEMLTTPAELAMEPMNMLMGQFMTGANPFLASSGGPSMGPALMSANSPSLGALSTPQLNASVVSAGVGRAGSIGALSVPASWANSVSATTPTHAVAAAAPGAGVSQVAAGGPQLPRLPSMGMPGRGTSAVTPAVAQPPAGATPRPVFS
jgi:PPE-repeat protein